MADSANNQESGGGEGQKQIQPAPPQEAKPAELIKTEAPGAVSGASHITKAEPISESKAAENSSLPLQENITVAVPAADSKVDAKTEDKVEEKKEDANIDKAVIPAEASTVEVKTEISSEGQVEEKKENIKPDKVAAEEEVKVEKQLEPKRDGLTNGGASNSNDWQNKEAALLVKIQELEKLKNEKSEDTLRMELKVREEEIDLLKARVKNLETELQAALSKPGAKNHEMIENIKQQHEELLSKARGMIFDKTKIVKNQELQIEALTTQVQSLKDINLITKDLLEIRNSEIKAMEDRLQVMEERFKTEKERYGLVLQRAQTSSTINDDLKKEYETQLKIFKELRLKYEQKVEALVAENNKLKMDLVKSTGGETSTDAPK